MADQNVVPISRSQATDPGFLADLAHEINVRLQKADDHRLSASLKLAEAKAACKKAGIAFKGWVLREIKQLGYTEATRLAKIGAASDPAKALADMRQQVAARVKRHDTENKGQKVALANATLPAPARGKDAICSRVTDAITALSGLPPAAEVAGYFKGTDRAVLVDERLTVAVQWLDEFSASWGDNAGDEDA